MIQARALAAKLRESRKRSPDAAPPAGPSSGGGEEPQALPASEKAATQFRRRASSLSSLPSLVHKMKAGWEPPPLSEDVVFPVAASRVRLDKLPVVLTGYKNLGRYLFFVCVFFAVLYLQVHTGTCITHTDIHAYTSLSL